MSRSTFIDALGAPKEDLRKKYKCYVCQVPITRKNFAMSSTAFTGEGWSEIRVFCHDCFLKPEAMKG